jgi:flagellar FliL protein
VRSGKKKLVLIALAALLVLALAGGGAGYWLWKKKQAALAAAEDGEGGADAAQVDAKAESSKHKSGHVPTFVPLDMFTVNLADRSAERYAQVGVTLELEDGTQVDRIKAFMPAIRNNILLVLGDKTAAQLMDRNGKERLAAEIRRAAVKPLGIDLLAPEPVAEAASGADAEPPKPRKRPAVSDEPVPVVAVHFSNFIIQ